jgi:cyanophycin synthetase
MTLDLEEMEQRPTNKIDGFLERMQALIPSLYEHRCSEDGRAVSSACKDGTWMGHVIEHIALELQTLAGMDCGFGRTRSTAKKANILWYLIIWRKTPVYIQRKLRTYSPGL